MPISILCPGCSVQLGLPDEAAGANVGCPRCGARMIVPSPSAPLPPPPVEVKKRPVKLVRVPDDDEDEVPEPPRKKRSSDDKPRRKKNPDEDTSGIWIGISVGACVVIATAIAAVFLAQEPEKKTSSDSSSSPSTPAPGSSSTGGINRAPIPTGWVEFNHPEGMFSAYVPGEAVMGRFGSTPSMPVRPSVPLNPGEIRTSMYEVRATAAQPLSCMMSITLFAPDQAGFFQGMFNDNRAGVNTPTHRRILTRDVQWGGLPTIEATDELIIDGQTRTTVVRSVLSGNRMYHFVLQRENAAPTDAEKAAFFDSFIPGK